MVARGGGGWLVAALLGLATWGTAGVADAAGACEAPRELVRFEPPLRNLAKAVASTRIVRIVALGSSSTAGTGASAPANAYPARLDAELDRRFPGHDFQVINRGVGGQLAAHMQARIASDVLPLEPALVIWQTGVNDAIQNVGVAAFRRTLDAGIAALKAAGSDVLLVGLQYYPRSERVAAYPAYRDALRETAKSHGLGEFRRFAVMRHYIESGRHRPEDLLAADRFHMNDFSYGCLAVLLAEAIAENVRRSGGEGSTVSRVAPAP
jgi:lysophospholipase L1-like esterase